MEVQSEIYQEDHFKKDSLIDLEFYEKEDTADPEIDNDGDFVVKRKRKLKLSLEFSSSTSLNLVGLQIWRGAFLLADYLLTKDILSKDSCILELGSGVGLTGIVAGTVAKKVICTDINKEEILNLISRNIERNQNILKAEIDVRPLDFYQKEFSFEMQRILREVDTVIAADVIYDDDLTEAFVDCLTKILLVPPKKTFYLALEKRYVFTIADLDVVPPCFDHFLNYLNSIWSKPPMSGWKIDKVVTDFKQSFDYKRTPELILWKIITNRKDTYSNFPSRPTEFNNNMTKNNRMIHSFQQEIDALLKNSIGTGW